MQAAISMPISLKEYIRSLGRGIRQRRELAGISAEGPVRPMALIFFGAVNRGQRAPK
jgi:hypothetical protein